MRRLLHRLAVLTQTGQTTPARHRTAIVLIVIGGIGTSFGGLYVRGLEQADAWQMNAYRGLVGGLVLLAVLMIRYGRRSLEPLRRLSLGAWLGATCLGLAAITYVLSLERTSVANTVFVMSATPFVSAGFAWIFLRECVQWQTLTAMAVSLAGVALMVREGFALGHPSGDLFALCTVTLFAIFSGTMRHNRADDMLIAIVIASFVTMLAGVVGTGGELRLTTRDLWLSVGWGLTVGILGDWIFVTAVRHLAAAETTLIMMMVPSILGPLWVWWLFDERASVTTLLGGTLILTALAGWTIRELRCASRRSGE